MRFHFQIIQIKILKILFHLLGKDRVIFIELKKIKNSIISLKKIRFKVILIVFNHQTVNITSIKNMKKY